MLSRVTRSYGVTKNNASDYHTDRLYRTNNSKPRLPHSTSYVKKIRALNETPSRSYDISTIWGHN